MNQCRKCNAIIPDKYNWWPALFCSECRAEVDREIFDIKQENDDLNAENEYLRSRCFDWERAITRQHDEFKKCQKRYDYLRKEYSVVVNDNVRLAKSVKDLCKTNDILSARIKQLEAEIEQLKNLHHNQKQNGKIDEAAE